MADKAETKRNVAVVTGAAGGIGRALVAELLQAQYTVVAVDAHAEALQAAWAAEPRVQAVNCDVTDPSAVEALAAGVWETHKQVDAVFCNAGVMPPLAPFFDSRVDDARWVFEVNVFGVWHTAQAFGRRLVAQTSQSMLVITGSEHSVSAPMPLGAAYTASKHALLGLADVLRMEMPDQVSVSLLCPGMVNTALGNSIERRPTAFGGAGSNPMGGSIPKGLAPERIAAHCLTEAQKGTPYIFTHHSVHDLVRERTEQLLAELARQTHAEDGSAHSDTRKLFQDWMGTTKD